LKELSIPHTKPEEIEKQLIKGRSPERSPIKYMTEETKSISDKP